MGYTETGIGYQKTDTSKEAARSNYEGKLTIRDRVHLLLEKTSHALSTEDIAGLLNVPYGSVQPRLSELQNEDKVCLLYTSPSPRDATLSRMPSSA